MTIFAFLTGYVCALKPLKQSRNGDTLGSFTSVAKSAFRRPPRLILPATIAMVISWTLAQFDGYLTALRSDCWWCRYASPKVKETLYEEVIELGRSFLSVWTNGFMAYDDHQWALLPLLLASMLVYMVLVATMFVRWRWRVGVYLGLFLYFHQSRAENVGMSSPFGPLGCAGANLNRDVPNASHIRHVPQRPCLRIVFQELSREPHLDPQNDFNTTGSNWPLHSRLPRRTPRMVHLVQLHVRNSPLPLPTRSQHRQTLHSHRRRPDYFRHLHLPHHKGLSLKPSPPLAREAVVCGVFGPRDTPPHSTLLDVIRHHSAAMGSYLR